MPDDIEISYSTLRVLCLVGLGAIMTLLSASMAFDWFAYKDIDIYKVVMAYVGIVFFGLGTLKILWTWMTANGPVIFISRFGIRDMRITKELIPWDSIEGISTFKYRRQKFIVFKITPALEKHVFATKTKQVMLLANRAVGVDGVAITAQGLTMDFDTLFNTCTAYFSASRPPHQESGTLPGQRMTKAA